MRKNYFIILATTLRQEYKALIRLGFPVLITQLGIIVVSFADTMMVGAYGTGELASAAFVNSLFLVAIVALIGFAYGMTPLVGALFGQGKLKRAGTVWRAGLLLNLYISLAITLIMGVVYFFLPHISRSEELMPLIEPYYLIVLSTILPSAIFNCCQQTSNGMTDTAMPMWIMIGGNLLNVAGNYILIFGHFGFPEMGLMGAGISTAVSRYSMAIAIVMLMLIRRRFRPLRFGVRLKANRDIYRKTWVTSYPVMIQSGMECSLWSLGAVVCIWFGAAQVASYQIVNIIGQLGFMIYLSSSVALSIRVANYTGILDIGGIRTAARAGLHIVLLMATLSSAALIIFGKQLLGLFTPDPTVIDAGLPLLFPLVLYQFCDATQLNFSNALRGTADVKPLLIVSAVCYMFVGVVSMFIFGVWLGNGNVGVYYSFALTLLCAAVMLYLYFRRAVRRLALSLP